MEDKLRGSLSKKDWKNVPLKLQKKQPQKLVYLHKKRCREKNQVPFEKAGVGGDNSKYKKWLKKLVYLHQKRCRTKNKAPPEKAGVEGDDSSNSPSAGACNLPIYK